jgi:hypothetical protein
VASTAQEEKFAKFQRQPEGPAAIALVRKAIQVASLSDSDRGVSWGVTVCPDSDSLIRLNVGNVAQLSVTKGRKTRLNPSGEVYTVVAAVLESKLGFFGAPRGLETHGGFPKWVDGSATLQGSFEIWATKLFNKSKVAQAFAAHAEIAKRNFADKNWHNPLVDQLLH